MNDAFTQGGAPDLRSARDLWPAGTLAARGGIAETFGTATMPAAVDQGQPLTSPFRQAPIDDAVVNLEPLGQVAVTASKAYRFDNDVVTIPTTGLRPGFYGAWLRHGKKQPYLRADGGDDHAAVAGEPRPSGRRGRRGGPERR